MKVCRRIRNYEYLNEFYAKCYEIENNILLVQHMMENVAKES
jgi:hypothetical protein